MWFWVQLARLLQPRPQSQCQPDYRPRHYFAVFLHAMSAPRLVAVRNDGSRRRVDWSWEIEDKDISDIQKALDWSYDSGYLYDRTDAGDIVDQSWEMRIIDSSQVGGMAKQTVPDEDTGR